MYQDQTTNFGTRTGETPPADSPPQESQAAADQGTAAPPDIRNGVQVNNYFSSPATTKTAADVWYSFIELLGEFGGVAVFIMFSWYHWLKASPENSIELTTLIVFLISSVLLLAFFKGMLVWIEYIKKLKEIEKSIELESKKK